MKTGRRGKKKIMKSLYLEMGDDPKNQIESMFIL